VEAAFSLTNVSQITDRQIVSNHKNNVEYYL